MIIKKEGGSMIYLTDVSRLDPEDPFWLEFISESRRRKMERCAKAEDKQRSLGAELLLCYAIANEAPDLALPPAYELRPDGKPFFADGRRHVSFAHSGKYAACALFTTPVGVDIQSHREADRRALQKALTKNQIDMIAAMPPNKQNDAYFDFWCMKESLVKCVDGVNLLQPAEFQFANLQGRLAVFYGNYTLRSFGVVPGYSLAVCCEAAFSPLIVHPSIDKIKETLQTKKPV